MTARAGGLLLTQVLLAGLTCWSAAAIWFDFPVGGLRAPLVIVSLLALAWLLLRVRSRRIKLIGWAFGVAVVLLWWFSLRPSNNRPWQTDVARMPWAEIQDGRVILHDIRDFRYVTETDYNPRWETRQFALSQLTGVDLFQTYWGSPWIAHAIVSFAFEGGDHLAMSIEARKEVGEAYSALRGFFRQYELIYLAAEERDVVRLRTNYRQGEWVYLYHTMTKPGDARNLFLQYLKWMNQVKRQPQWYNALTSNCTSGVIGYLAESKVGGLSRWDWRSVLNGHGDRMLYDLGDLSTDGLAFAELKRRALINEAARYSDDDADFSAKIREHRPGF